VPAADGKMNTTAGAKLAVNISVHRMIVGGVGHACGARSALTR